jgi:hypothetical protein
LRQAQLRERAIVFALIVIDRIRVVAFFERVGTVWVGEVGIHVAVAAPVPAGVVQAAGMLAIVVSVVALFAGLHRAVIPALIELT